VAMLRKQIVILGLGVLAVLGAEIDARSDTLFNGREPVKIGHGKKQGLLIRWTDCSDKNPETFDAPPYSVDAADNCNVKGFSFGLKCAGTSCRVVDETAAQKYLPGVHEGDKVSFHIEGHSVELKSETTTRRLEK
jgi:hypothetical protein